MKKVTTKKKTMKTKIFISIYIITKPILCLFTLLFCIYIITTIYLFPKYKVEKESK